MKPILLLSCLMLSPAVIHAQTKALAQDYRVVFHNPDRERYVEGPGLVRLDDGSLVAVVPVVPREEWSKEHRATQSVTHILRSSDGGQTWQPATQLPYYSSAPFLHDGALYLLTNKGGTKSRNDDLLLLKSTDGGKTWSEPVTLFTGHFWNCHTGMVQHADRRFLMLQYSVDCLNWFQGGCVAQAGKISQSFMYARPVIDGDDLAIIARSSINAPNQHDADHATFQRVKNFRSLALKLTPEPEEWL